MAHIFCPSCGSKSEYKFASPNFCFKCGYSYSQASNSIKAANGSATIQSKNSDPDERDDWDDEDEDSEKDFGDFSNSTRVPRISRIQVETDSSTDVKIIKFGDLLNENATSSFKRPKNLDFGNM